MGATGGRRKRSRSPRRDDESRASGSSARTPRQRSSPGHPHHRMSPAPSARRLGTTLPASEALISIGSQPALNFDVEVWASNGAGAASSTTPLLAIKSSLFYVPLPEAPLGPSLMRSQFGKMMEELQQRDLELVDMNVVHHRQRHQFPFVEQRLFDKRVELANEVRDNEAVMRGFSNSIPWTTRPR